MKNVFDNISPCCCKQSKEKEKDRELISTQKKYDEKNGRNIKMAKKQTWKKERKKGLLNKKKRIQTLTHVDEAAIIIECPKVRSRQREKSVKLGQERLHIWMGNGPSDDNVT